MATYLLVRARNTDWLHGAVGLRVQACLEWNLRRKARVERTPVGFSVRGEGSLARLRDRVVDAIRQLELDMQRIEPVNYALLGPITTGTVDCVSGQGTTRMWEPSWASTEHGEEVQG